MARKRERPKKRRPRWLVTIVFLFLFALAAYFILSLPIWEIKEVVVNGTRILSAEEIKALAGIPLSENLFFTSFSRARGNLAKIPGIKRARFYRIPPATVLISVTERRPVATVVFPRRSVIIDEDGYILNLNPNISLNIPNLADLPVVSGISEDALGSDRIQGEAAQVISHILSKLSRFLESKRLQLELGGLENVSFLLDDLLRVRVGDTEEIRRKMEVFEALMPQIDGRWPKVEYMDVRFPDNPVIKFK